MASFHAQLVAVMVAAVAVLIGCLMGDLPLADTLDVVSVFVLFGCSMCVVRLMAGSALDLYERAGDVIILGMMLLF